MSELVLGFRFYPTEEELVSFYLFHNVRGQHHDIDLVITVVDVYSHEPWQLPGVSGTLCRGDMEQWFFFVVPRQEREARGGRPARITPAGYWKVTGSPSYVYSTDNRVIGLKKTMVFYKGQCTNVQKTKWKMNEFRAIQEERAGAAAADESFDAAVPKVRYEYSLCRVYVELPCLRPTAAGSCSYEEYKRPQPCIRRRSRRVQCEHRWVDPDEGNSRRPVVGVGVRDGHLVGLGTTIRT